MSALANLAPFVEITLFRNILTSSIFAVTSLNLSAGISCLCMNLIVSVALTRPFIPCANLPNSSAADLFHTSRNLGCFKSWRYWRSCPVSWSRTAFAASRCRRATLSAIDSVRVPEECDSWRLARIRDAIESDSGGGNARIVQY
eukprot:scaffold53546_cov34-Cyclotella_meneghiniana.AAC.2